MTNQKSRARDHRHATRRAHALQRAMRSVDSQAVRKEILSLLGH